MHVAFIFPDGANEKLFAKEVIGYVKKSGAAAVFAPKAKKERIKFELRALGAYEMCENDEMKGKIDKEELLLELSQCREDERNCKNQMVQVISTASTILGVLFGSTYFSFGKGGFSKVVFYLSIAVFCVAFTYIIVLGIGSTLRYYYVQKIEDLLSLESEDSKFLHWGSYFAPIVTRNRKHIRSMHTLLFYVCYTLFI